MIGPGRKPSRCAAGCATARCSPSPTCGGSSSAGSSRGCRSGWSDWHSCCSSARTAAATARPARSRGSFFVASALGAPIAGRLVDRRGQTRILLQRAVLFPALLLGACTGPARRSAGRTGRARRRGRGAVAAGRRLTPLALAAPVPGRRAAGGRVRPRGIAAGDLLRGRAAPRRPAHGARIARARARRRGNRGRWRHRARRDERAGAGLAAGR